MVPEFANEEKRLPGVDPDGPAPGDTFRYNEPPDGDDEDLCTQGCLPEDPDADVAGKDEGEAESVQHRIHFERGIEEVLLVSGLDDASSR